MNKSIAKLEMQSAPCAQKKTVLHRLTMPFHREQLRWLSIMLLVFTLGSCSRLDGIQYAPQVSAEEFLRQQPSIDIHLGARSLVWTQPTSSILVFFVGFYTMYVGYRFISRSAGSNSLRWWGIGLLLSGAGALLAGISYQAFGYEIKCAGREFCTFTDWWEIHYMFMSVLGMACFLIGTAHVIAEQFARTRLYSMAILGTALYAYLLGVGIWRQDRLFTCFEFMAVFSSLPVLLLLLIHTDEWSRTGDAMQLALLRGWLIFVGVFAAYIIYLNIGISTYLWQHGVWFSENDVLHVGMFYWVYYLGKKLPLHLKDVQAKRK